MKKLVVYDSLYGNTKLVAEIIARELGADTNLVFVGDVTPATLVGISALVVGSPINGWRPSQRTGAWLATLKPNQLDGVRVTTFDTRMKTVFHGDAAKKISQALVTAGASMICDPSWFVVKGKEGPLLDGELQRAAEWGKAIAARIAA